MINERRGRNAAMFEDKCGYSSHTWGYHQKISKDIGVISVNWGEICRTPVLLVRYPMWDLTTLKKQYHIILLHGTETVMLHDLALITATKTHLRMFYNSHNVTDLVSVVFIWHFQTI